MDFSTSGIIYAFMVIPSLFALVVMIQGIEKLTKRDPEGWVALGFGLVFFVLIVAAYYLYIK